MNDARANELVDTIFMLAGGDGAARALVTICNELVAEANSERREELAHVIACAAFSHSRAHDAALRSFVENHSRAASPA